MPEEKWPMANPMLKGVRVTALVHVWAGPWAGAVLSDMGAEVIRVESHQRLDPSRGRAPFEAGKPGVNRSIVWNMHNRGMKSCTVNLKQPRGVELFRELVRKSDVVIDNLAPRVLPGLGLDYAALKAIKPDIIMVSLPGFGSAGPDRDYISYASTVASVGGLLDSFGYPGGEPALMGVHPPDPIGGMWGVVCALAALNHRSRTGRGQHLDLAQTEATTALLPEVIMEYSMNGRIRPRMGNRDEIMAPHGCYPCSGEDKWVAIAVRSHEEWDALRRIMEYPPWSDDEKFSDQYRRWQNQDLLNKHIAGWTRNFTHYEVMQKLQDSGIAAGAVLNIEELLNDPHVRERQVFFEQQHADAGKTLAYRPPWASALTKANPPAPCLGEHNGYVYKELLGLSDSAYDQLVDDKIIY